VVFDDAEPRDALHGHVRFGLKALKGAGDKAIETIIAERERGGSYGSIFEFCERLPPGAVTKATLEALIRCSAFDSVHGRANRAAMVATVEQAMSAGAKAAADKAAGQGGLFGGGAAPPPGAPGPARATRVPAPVTLAKAEPWSEADTLTHEKEALGFYVSSHPLDRWRHWAGAFATTTAAGAKELAQDARVVIAAMVQSVRTVLIRNGKSAGQKMAILTVEDLTGACDCVLFTEAYAKFAHLAEPERVVFILGRIDLKRGEPQVIIDRLVPIDGTPLEGGRVRLMVDELRLNGTSMAALTRVADLIRHGVAGAPANGTAPQPAPAKKPDDAPTLFPVEIVIGTDTDVAILAADAKIRITLQPDLVKAIEIELGQGMVRVVGGLAFEKTEPARGKWKPRRDED